MHKNIFNKQVEFFNLRHQNIFKNANHTEKICEIKTLFTRGKNDCKQFSNYILNKKKNLDWLHIFLRRTRTCNKK